MAEHERTQPMQSFAATCSLCITPVPVHKDGMCARHHAEFGPDAWKHVGEKAKPVRGGFRLSPLHKAGPARKGEASHA